MGLGNSPETLDVLQPFFPMNNLGHALLKLAEQQGLSQRTHREKSARQLSRLFSKMKMSRKKLGKSLEQHSKLLNRSIGRKGLSGFLKRIFMPWRSHCDRRQLALVDTLLKWHKAESDEMLEALKTFVSPEEGQPATGQNGQ